MKNFIIIALMAFIVGLGLSGCEKEKVNNTIPTSSQNEELNSSKGTIVVFYFTWDEWGRKKKNCDGGGLCNFRLERVEIHIGLPKSSVGHTSPVYKNEKDDYYVEIPIDEDFVFEDDTKCLYVDEDIEALGPDGNYYVLKAGAYSYDNNIGDLGGYLLQLEKNNIVSCVSCLRS